MPKTMTFKQQMLFRRALDEYLEKYGDVDTLDKLSQWIGEKTGIFPDPSTLSIILKKDYGYERRWVQTKDNEN